MSVCAPSRASGDLVSHKIRRSQLKCRAVLWRDRDRDTQFNLFPGGEASPSNGGHGTNVHNRETTVLLTIQIQIISPP
jgi:hypothetical protein